jgi:hypothetical protein
MKYRAFLATFTLSASLLSAATLRSQAEPVFVDPSPVAIMPNIDWNSVSGVMWAQRFYTTYVLSSTNPTSGLQVRAYSPDQQGYEQEMAALASNIAAGGFIWYPSLLGEWNPLPDLPVVNRGTSADNYQYDGNLLASGEDFQYTSPSQLFAAASNNRTSTFNTSSVARIGASPETFGGVPAVTRTTSTTNAVSTVISTPSIITSAPVVLTSPDGGRGPGNNNTRQQEPTGNVSNTAPMTIALVAEAFMTTNVNNSDTVAVSNPLVSRSVIRNSIGTSVDTPEPASMTFLGLGLSVFAFRRLRRPKC